MNADYSQGPMTGPPPVAPVNTNANNKFLSTDIPPIPEWLRFLLVPILLLNIIVLGLVAFALSVVNDNLVDDYVEDYFGEFPGLSFNVFACVWTILAGLFIFLSLSVWRGSHYRWIIFILLILSTIWWLVAFACLASDAKDALDSVKLADRALRQSSGYYYSPSRIPNSLLDWYSRFRTASKGMAGASGLGALIWILFIVFTIFYSIGLFRKQYNGAVTYAQEAPMGTIEQKQAMQQPYPVVQSPPPVVQSPPPTAQFGNYYPPNPAVPGSAPPYNQ